ncbi:metalloprotease TldD [Candidatus Methylospira mobilis]|uniref:Metalloprotease TldD n=1 Tax=Candidatus Methylospira mobilis TaxID=1808979 RepID=A0A5Q0BFL5_9GAMM|nr:metalloprotease TldD [Candidatus Methylospira mobilis]QFY42665.1 metalloprotease TldD [Candidatus Methylospira mobilis]WNV04217.1 metalloprotease TldD [Candidatus Methylospira mobilis]
MTANILEKASRLLLAPAEISLINLEGCMGSLMGTAIDAGDIYLQTSYQESWVLEDGIVKDASFNIEQGVGIRAISGEKTGFSYSDEITHQALLEAARNARAIAAGNQDGRFACKTSHVEAARYNDLDPLGSLTELEKIDLLRRLDRETRALDHRVEQVIVSLSGSYDVILIINDLGLLQADIRPLVRLNVSVIVNDNGKREHASYGGGARTDYGYFLEADRASAYAVESVRQALVNLEAVDAPAGTMTVVLGPGWPGILLHEAIGHGLEGDFNRKGSSAFTGRIGQRVASPLCTIVDDGTLIGRRGSLNFDDEGTQAQRTVLIEDGILQGYMQDRLNARLMGVPVTGNGRRESYAHLPMPRMTNTYMLAGAHDPAEILASVDKGLYARSFGGGQVDITSGKFVFSASEAYLIENGKLTRPVKGATLIGNGPDVLTRVSMVGNDLEMDPGVGSCGKGGQSVPVGVGQPTLRVDGLTVGGTQVE